MLLETVKTVFGEKNFVATIWTWLGSIAGLFCLEVSVTNNPGLRLISKLFHYLGLPDGAIAGVGATEQWIIDRASFVGPLSGTAVVLSLLALFTSSRGRYTVPSGPAAATFWIALMLGHIAGGLPFWTIFGLAVVPGLFWWFFSEDGRKGQYGAFDRLGITVVEIFVQAIYLPLIVTLTMLFPRDRPIAPERQVN